MQKLTTIQEINQAIMFGEFTNTELEGMIDAIKFARAGLASVAGPSACDSACRGACCCRNHSVQVHGQLLA